MRWCIRLRDPGCPAKFLTLPPTSPRALPPVRVPSASPSLAYPADVVPDPQRLFVRHRQREGLRELSDAAQQPVLALLAEDVLLRRRQQPEAILRRPGSPQHPGEPVEEPAADLVSSIYARLQRRPFRPRHLPEDILERLGRQYRIEPRRAHRAAAAQAPPARSPSARRTTPPARPPARS